MNKADRISDVQDLLVEQLRDLYNGEKRLGTSLIKLYSKISNHYLKSAIKEYIEVNEEQLMRLKQSFGLLFVYGHGEKCEAIQVLVRAFEELERRCTDTRMLDVGIITAIRHIIHYKVAGYGSVCSYAKMLKLWKIAEIMHISLDYEHKIDRQLSTLSEEVIHPKALAL